MKDRWEDIRLCEERLIAYRYTARELRAASDDLRARASQAEEAAEQYTAWIALLKRNGGIAIAHPPSVVAEDMQFKA